MNKFIGAILSFFIASTLGFSQKNLSAKDAVMIALENNFQVQIAEKQIQITEKNNKWSEAGLFPTVTLSAGLNNTIQDNTNNPFTFTPGIILNQGLAPSLAANWNIFSGLAVKMTKQRLEQLEEQSRGNAFAIMENTIQDVLKAYYAAYVQKERMDLFDSLKIYSKKKFDYYQVKEKYTKSNSLEQLQFRNQYLTDSTNYLMQKISYENAIRNLLVLMNVQDESERNTLPILTDKLDIELPSYTYEVAYAEMMGNNQNIKNQYISLELQKTQTAYQKSFLYPTLSLQLGFNPSYAQFRQLNNNSNQTLETTTLTYYGNLNLRYTIFNNWKTKRAVEVSKIQEEITSLNIQSFEKSLSYSLQNLIQLYEVRTQLTQISAENLVYAQKAWELAKAKFQSGSINSIDLTIYQNNYQNTLIQHYENQFNKMDTYLEIYKLMGKLRLDYDQP